MKLEVRESSIHCINVVLVFQEVELAYLERFHILIEPVYPYTILNRAISLGRKNGNINILLDGTFIPGSGLVTITYRRLGDLMDSKMHYSFFVE